MPVDKSGITVTIPITEYESMISRMERMEKENQTFIDQQTEAFEKVMTLFYQEDDRQKKVTLTQIMSILTGDDPDSKNTTSFKKLFCNPTI